MNDVLSGIERDLIVSYLSDGKIDFTLIPDQPAERIFSFTTGEQGVRVLPEGIIIFTDSDVFPPEFSGRPVQIRFYFRKLGLFFEGRLDVLQSGSYAVVIPREILRLATSDSLSGSPFSCKIFLNEDFKGDYIECTCSDSYPLFSARSWQSLSTEHISDTERFIRMLCKGKTVSVPAVLVQVMKRSGKALWIDNGHLPGESPFPVDVCLLVSDFEQGAESRNAFTAATTLESGLYFILGYPQITGDMQAFMIDKEIIMSKGFEAAISLLSICGYFVAEKYSMQQLKDRVEPLSLIYISNSLIVLACRNGTFPLQKDVLYPVLMKITVQSLIRTITMSCSISELYSDVANKTCAICKLSDIKQEDTRFLYESFTGKKYI